MSSSKHVMAATRVYGSKVKEPKVVRRNVLPAEDLSADLAKAWSTFGEAKTVLQRLETKSTSPPAKASRPRQPVVTFKPHPPQSSKETDAPANHVTGILKNGKSQGKTKEYVLEPTVLNETRTQEGSLPIREKKSHTAGGGQEAPPTVGGETQSNPTAVFGPPAAFGGSSATTTQRSHHTRNSSTRSLPVSRSSTQSQISGHKLTSSATVTNAGPGARVQGSKRPRSEEVPIRRFELPPDVAKTLTSKVEQQKLVLSRHQTSKLGQSTRTRDYKPSSYQDSGHSSSTVAKKRKVATAPPPHSYAGFSSTLSTPHTTLRWRSNVEQVGGGAKRQTTHGRSATGTSKAGLAGSKVRKVHKMTSSNDVKAQNIVTTSSWRSGKQLTDRILREKQPKSLHTPESSSSSLVSSGESAPTAHKQQSGFDPLSTWTKKSEGKFGDILDDLELSVDAESATEEDGKEERKTGLKRSQSGKSNTKQERKKQKFTDELTYPTERVRHYDQSQVQAYIQQQREGRRRRVEKEKLSLAQASSERQKKLTELYESQKKRVELNLRKKQKKRHEEFVKTLESGPGVHIHLRDPSTSTMSDEALPTLTITQAYITQHSPRSSSTKRVPSHMHTSTSPSPHLHPSPPSHPSPKASPFRYHQRHRTEPSSSLHRGQSSSPSSSPRTYTYHYSSSPGKESTEHAQSSPRPHPSSPPTSTAHPLFKPTPPKSPPSYDERLQAIRASALKLKEQIALESKKALNRSQEEAVPRYHHQGNERGHTSLTDLPGVHNVRAHAVLAERERRRNEAACKIQAAYRGHNVRKILRRPPPPQVTTPPTVTPPTTTPSVSVSALSAAAPAVTMVTPTVTVTTPSVTQTSPLRSAPVHKQVAPWQQGGGDRHSVINVFTRQHEHLQETLSLLQDQKREEIRDLSSREQLATPEGSQHSMTPSPSASSHLSPRTGELSPSKHSEESGGRVTSTPPLSSEAPHTPDHHLASTPLPKMHSWTSESPLSLSPDSLYTPPDSMSTPVSSAQQSPSSQEGSSKVQRSHEGTSPSHGYSPLLQQGTSPKSPASCSDPNISSEGGSQSTLVNEDTPAITPPGSTSFVESFSAVSPHPPHVPPPTTTHTMSGRLSPRSLELEHRAQLNLYETVEENLRHLSHVQQTRDVSLAQQESVTLAQQLREKDQAHRGKLSALATQAKQEAGQRRQEAELAQRMQRLEQQMNSKVQEHSQKMVDLQADSERAVREATLRLTEARSAATSAVISAAQQEVQAAHNMAVSVATAATKEAVKEALRQSRLESSRTVQYDSDFDPSTAKSQEGSNQTSVQESGAGEETSMDTTLTPPPADETLVDGVQDSHSEHEVPEDITEMTLSQSHPPDSDSEGSLSRPQTPSQGEQSPISPAGDESFFVFTNRMVTEYVKEEEARARHRAALLDLREKALREKTKVHLKWLQLKQRDVRSKGADDLMPPLKRKERGIIKGFQKEKAEIQRLKTAQEAAAQERKLMLLEQQEISRMRKSAQFYREKIHSYRSRSHTSPSPVPSIDDSIPSHLTHSIATSLSDLSVLGEGLATPSGEGMATPTEHLLSASFPSYSPSSTREVSIHEASHQTSPSNREDVTRSEGKQESRTSGGGRGQLAGWKTGGSDSLTLEDLKETEASEAEKYLTQRKLQLERKRQAAEEVIRKHRELLKREQELNKEEESVNQLVDQAMEMLKQAPLSSSRGQILTREPLAMQSLSLHLEPVGLTSSASGFPRQQPSSVSELLSATESIVEQVSGSAGGSKERLGTVTSDVPSEYATNTFEESLNATLSHHPHPLTTSTPETKMEEGPSLLDNESVADSVSTATSTGSGLEARIRALKEQLRQRKEEVRRAQNEQRRRKKAILREHEEQLMKKIRAVDQQTERVKSTAPPPLVLSPDTPFSLSEQESGGTSQQPSRESSPEVVHQTLSSREESGSPQLVSSKEQSSSPQEELAMPSSPIATELSRSPLPRDSLVSPLPAEESLSYTPFSSVVQEDSRELTHFTEPVHTVMDDGTKSVLESDNMESKLGSVEALVPPPGFETVKFTTERAETLPSLTTPVSSEVATETLETSPPLMTPVSGEVTMETVKTPSLITPVNGEVAVVTPETPPPLTTPVISEVATETAETSPPPTTPVSEQPVELVSTKPTVKEVTKEEREDVDSSEEDSDPLEPAESLESRSDVSLPISVSGSRGGDSEEEVNYSLGQRVLVSGAKEGVVRFIGKTHFAPGLWIGVEFSEPRGLNDGSINDHQYFDCPPKHGVFAPPRKVVIIEDTVDTSSQGSTVCDESEVDESMSGGMSPPPEGVASPPAMVLSPPEEAEVKDEYSDDFEMSVEQENKAVDEHSLERAPSPDDTVLSTNLISEHISVAMQEGEGSLSEQQAPAEVELVGEKPDVLPSAPAQPLVHLQPATPTPAPPPEFAEGASREGSTEPPPLPGDHGERKPETLTNELTQELMNEAYETMHKIWKSKRIHETQPEKKVDIVQVPKDKEVPLSLDDKADRITDQLFTLLLQSESSLMTNILASKADAQKHVVETEPTSPVKPRSTLRISVANIRESSPPPLSPPSPYRIPPAVMPPTDHSPPNSPPCHLPQHSAARVAAGDISPFAQEQALAPAKLERSYSTESLVHRLDTIKVKTAQCMVPSEREQVDEVIRQAWDVAMAISPCSLHSQNIHCPEHILRLFQDVRELSPEEEHCHRAYIQLTFDLTVDVIRQLHPLPLPTTSWLQGAVVRGPPGGRGTQASLELVQKRVYAALVRGQLPADLPAVKFLHKRKRPGGKEVDFVDGILIKELRYEEPSWVDYHKDEVTVKLRAADSLLDSLLTETVQIVHNIGQKKKQRFGT